MVHRTHYPVPSSSNALVSPGSRRSFSGYLSSLKPLHIDMLQSKSQYEPAGDLVLTGQSDAHNADA